MCLYVTWKRFDQNQFHHQIIKVIHLQITLLHHLYPRTFGSAGSSRIVHRFGYYAG